MATHRTRTTAVPTAEGGTVLVLSPKASSSLACLLSQLENIEYVQGMGTLQADGSPDRSSRIHLTPRDREELYSLREATFGY